MDELLKSLKIAFFAVAIIMMLGITWAAFNVGAMFSHIPPEAFSASTTTNPRRADVDGATCFVLGTSMSCVAK